MKRAFLIACAGLLLRSASGQTSFINNQGIFSPPDPPPQGWVDFYQNNNLISIGFAEQFTFFDVNTYSNRGVMEAPLGFRFDTTPSGGGSNHWASSFGNATTAIVAAGSNSFVVGVAPAALGSVPVQTAVLDILATNVFSTGVLDASVDGRIHVVGNDLDFSRGTFHIEGQAPDAIGTAFPVGLFDASWGTGVQPAGVAATAIHAGNFTGLQGPFSSTTFPFASPYGITGNGSISVSGATVAVNRVIILQTNVYYQIVFVVDDADLFGKVSIRFAPTNSQFWSLPIVQWQSVNTNSFGQNVTNSVYLADRFPIVGTNRLMSYGANGFTPGGQPLFMPTNYDVKTSLPGFSTLPIGNVPYNTNLLTVGNAFQTNTPFSANILFSFLELAAEPFTFAPDIEDPDQSGTNIPGRVEINATGRLDMTRSRVAGANVINLNAAHWAGSSNAQMVAFDTLLNLASTNGQLAITNTVVPFITRLNGPIDAWSAIWTNSFDSNQITTNMVMGSNVLTTNTVTWSNSFHVLIVGSSLLTTSPVFVEKATLQSTNVVISDILNIATNLLVTAQNLTITSNNPPGPNQVGEIILPSPATVFSFPLTTFSASVALPTPPQAILWSPSFPNLQNMTNFGIIEVANSTFFSHRASQFFPSPGDSPYLRFVNHGEISSSGGNSIWANYFEDTGLSAGFPDDGVMASGFGDLTVTANTALIGSGTLTAPQNGDLSITSGTLTITNSFLFTGGLLTLNVTTNLTDGGTLGNNWESGDGFYVPIKPPTGDLLGTSIQLDSLPNAEVFILWPGTDFGPSVAGYSNNLAVGHLILNGGDADATYHFVGAGPGNSNAMYVDLLELSGGAVDGTALELDPNFAIYFNRATNSSTSKDLTLTLDGATVFGGGQLHQVAHSGLFQLAGGSIANNISLSISLTNQPPNTALISWQGVPNATNGLYSSANFSGTNWNLVTNIVEGATSTKLTVPVSTLSPGASYYQLRASPVH